MCGRRDEVDVVSFIDVTSITWGAAQPEWV